MEQSKYNKIMELKRQGHYSECLQIYLDRLKEIAKNNENEEAIFYDGLAKIFMLSEDYLSAKITLIEVFKKLFIFRHEVLVNSINDNNTDNAISTILIQQEIIQSMKVYEALSNVVHGDFATETYPELKLSKTELMLCLCSGHDQTYYRYLFCLACENQNPYGCDEVVNMMRKNKTAILNTLKGTATEVEKQKENDTWNFFLRGGQSSNKFAIIHSILPAFAKAINSMRN